VLYAVLGRFAFMTGSSPLVALSVLPSGSQPNPRSAHWTGHSILTSTAPH
jgi:hypothetical protein